MAANDEPLKDVEDVLKEFGYGEFEVKKLELVPGYQATRTLNPKLESMVGEIVQRLHFKGHGRFYVETLDLGLRLETTACPPDEEPRQVKEELPDGTIRWVIKCVKK
jgi:hypothetical protein